MFNHVSFTAETGFNKRVEGYGAIAQRHFVSPVQRRSRQMRGRQGGSRLH